MKKALKKLLSYLWSLTGFFRRPVKRCLQRLSQPLFAEHFLALDQITELSLNMNGMIRELARLQAQVDALQHMIEEQARARPPLAAVAPGSSGERRLRAG